MRVLITAPMAPDLFRRFLPADLPPDVTIETLADRSEAGLIAAAPGADVVVADWQFVVPISKAVIDRLAGCRLIQQPSAGYQLIDVAAALKAGIPVANAPGNSVAVAEWTVMAIIALLRQAFHADRAMRKGQWLGPEFTRELVELEGKTVGIVGYGRIGREVAKRLAPFECRILAYDIVRTDDMPFCPLPELLAQSDAVTLHVPLNAGTKHLVDPFAMKAGSVIVNAARGNVLDEGAVVAALDQGHLKGAALDVFSREPLDPEAPIRTNPLILLSPHAAGVTRESGRRIIQMTADNVARALRGETPQWLVTG